LLLENARQVAVLLWANPYVSVTPFAELAEFLYFGMRVLDVVFLGKSGWVIDPDVAA
jgi:hypothetical protein